jgi:hypothetical protein
MGAKRRAKLPGFRWRILAHHHSVGGQMTTQIDTRYDGTEGVCFDELVIDGWFHIEQMSDRHWHCIIGDLHIDAHPRKDGRVAITGWWDTNGYEELETPEQK